MEFTSLWDEASRDLDAEASLRSLTSARVKGAQFWPFLASAEDEGDFANRVGLVEAGLVEAASYGGISFDALVDSLHGDFRALALAREAKDGENPFAKKDDSDKDDSDDDSDDEDDDGDDSDSDDDDDDSDDEDKDPDDDGDDDSTDEGDTDNDGGKPWEKKSAKTAAGFGMPDSEEHDDDKDYENCPEFQEDGSCIHSDHMAQADADKYRHGNDYSSDFDDPHYGPNHAHSEDNYGDPYGRSERRMEASVQRTAAGDYRVGGGDDWMNLQSHDPGHKPTPSSTLGTFSDCTTCGGGLIQTKERGHPHADKDGWTFIHVKAPSKSSSFKTASHEPIGYTYEADVHCPRCAEARHGRSARGFIGEDAHDGEGNPVGAVAPWDETHPHGEHCGTCHDEIAEPYDHNPAHCGVDGCSGVVKDGKVLRYPDSHHHSKLFPVVALEDGEDPLCEIQETVPGGEGQPEEPNSHTESFTGSLLDRFSAVLHKFVKE